MGNILKRRLRGPGSPPDQPKPVRRVTPNHLIPEEAENPNRVYLTNKIKTTKYSIISFLPKNIFEQFHRIANLYFLFIVLLNWIPQVNAFGKEVAMIPVIFVLAVTAVKDAYEDYRRYKSDKRINHNKCRVFSRNDKRYIGCEWHNLMVGDIIHLSCNEVIPADIILLRSSDDEGVAHIDTSNLDGENNLKQRHIVRELHQGEEFKPTMFTHTIECELPNMEIYKFRGAMLTQLNERIPLNNNNLLLRGCIIRNTDFVEGIIVYAGHDTKALLNNRGPRYKRSKLERLINRDVLWSVVLLLLMCFLCALGTALWLKQHKVGEYPVFLPTLPTNDTNPVYVAFLRFWTFMILFQVLIPLSLYVSVELIKIGQVYFIENDIHLYHEGTDKPIECRALNINEELGQIQYVFSDKTGTLTENKMVFKQCTIGGTNYGSTSSDTSLFDDPNMSKASISSTSTLGMNSMQHDPRIDAALSNMKISELGEVTVDSHQDTKIQEFFLLMAVCNTVVVSANEHIDRMDEQGIIHDSSIHLQQSDADSSYVSDQPSLERYARLDSNNHDSISSRLRFPSMRRNRDRKRLENEDSDCDVSVASSANVSVDTTSQSMMSERMLHKRYEAESPDELALVHAACAYRCRLTKRTLHHVHVYLPGEGEVKIEVMHILPFDSNRKRMSVILQHPDTDDIILYTKGADSAITSCLRQRKIDDTKETWLYKETQEHLTHYAKQGLRTLCMAKKVIPLEEYKSWLRSHLEAESIISDNRERLLHDSACQIECDLELLGATGIEDRLQDGVPETIMALRKAGIKVWVLTGDKQETAINIAHSCHLLSFQHDLIVLNARNKDVTHDTIQMHIQRLADQARNTPPENTDASHTPSVHFQTGSRAAADSRREIALVIDGRTLGFALKYSKKEFLDLAKQCNSVVCCRVTPYQKADVVKLVRDKLQQVTLAIGDGANDVSMIQTADVGVGISGQEGMQAVMASDFALPRFRFLKRTLLVHGHWCYERLAKMALYMWYKNTNFIFVLMWYQLFNGFSSQSCIDDFNLIVYNLFYTSLPPIVMGIFDRCADDRTLMENPYLYREGQSSNSPSHYSKIYKRHSYFVSILDALYQSVVMFFIPYLAYQGSSTGIWEFGIGLCAICIYVNTLHFCLETKHWNVFHWLSVILSVVAFYCVNIYMTLACTSCGHPANPYGVFFKTLTSPLHWMTAIITTTLALLPRYLIRAYQGSYNAPLCVQAQLLKRRRSGEKKREPFASWTSLSNRVSMSFGYNQSDAIISDQRYTNSTDL